jgi:hypothetical protein
VSGRLIEGATYLVDMTKYDAPQFVKNLIGEPRDIKTVKVIYFRGGLYRVIFPDARNPSNGGHPWAIMSRLEQCIIRRTLCRHD